MDAAKFDLQKFLQTYPNVNGWPEADLGGMTPEKLKLYQLKKAAVEMVYDGVSLRQITNKTGIRREGIYATLLRCVSMKPLTGHIYGFAGLIPNLRIKTYTRLAPDTLGAGKAGLLGKFFSEHPEIKERLDAYHLKKVERLIKMGFKPSPELIISGTLSTVGKTYGHFVQLCEQSHIPANSYPYTSNNGGYEAIRRYLSRLVTAHLREALRPVYGSEASKRMARTSGEGHTKPTHPYVQVSVDELTADVEVPLVVPDLLQGDRVLLGARIQVALVVEMLTTAILAFALSYNQHATSTETVMRALYRAIKPWTERKFTLPGLSYQSGDGFPSGQIPSLQWATWSETLLDNAMAHKSGEVQRVTQDVMGSEVLMGAVGAPEVREGIERVVRALSIGAWPELPGATGSSPTDPRRNDPLKEALSTPTALNFLILDEFLEAWCARYNNTPTQRLGFKTPLQFLKEAEDLERLEVAHFEADHEERLYRFGTRVQKSVSGNPAEGRPIYCEFLHARYSSEELAYAASLLGKKVVLYIHPEDARYALAYYPDGTELGLVKVKGPWAAYQHTLDIRRLYSKLKPRRHLVTAKPTSPVHVVAAYLMAEAHKSKAKAMRYQEFKDITGFDESELLSSQSDTGKGIAEFAQETQPELLVLPFGKAKPGKPRLI